MINLPLDRTFAEFLLELLEEDLTQGWRRILADDIREMLGMSKRE